MLEIVEVDLRKFEGGLKIFLLKKKSKSVSYLVYPQGDHDCWN